MDKITIRPAVREDCAEIKRLIFELADYEKFPEGPEISIESLERDGFDTVPSCYRCLVAEDANVSSPSKCLLGYALYYPIYFSWRGRALRLEDLYVTPDVRGRGLGRALFAGVAKDAVHGGYCRITFTALSWNPACDFYNKLGAEDMTKAEERHMWRIEGEAMTMLANSLDTSSAVTFF